MKKYIAPEIELAKFATEDVVTTSQPVVIPEIKLNIGEGSPAYSGDYGTLNF